MSTVSGPGPLARLARRHGLVRSPLRRTTDRVEAVVTAGLAMLALLVMALAIIIAIGTYQRELAAAAAAHQTSVTAVLVTDAQPQHATSSALGVRTERIARARWSLPDGQQRSGPLWVGAGRHAGDRVPIWLDRHGNRVDAPQTPGEVIANAVVTGAALVMGGWALLGALWWTICRVLGRINAAWWDVQWARTGPGWNRRTWQ
ncbi:MAG: hypothetical protein M3Y48_20065 [Actinomycetota bacterium]|nr:hypothetical protein [Actinomycetota bacterium]MDQ2883388.1 hypothetical protein [Actinomycetota bacterium]PZS11801.1 MAG: hypothetical protein DLM60_23655 [Pseudonocardiales bacterium]